MPQAWRGTPASTPVMAPSSSWAGRMARQRRPGGFRSTAGLRAGTSERPRAAAGRSTPSRSAIVPASSSTERGSGLVVPGTAPAPQTTNGTGLSPQSRWPWPPIPRPWP